MATETLDPKAAAGHKGRVAQTMNQVRDEVNKQERILINIPRPSHVKKGMYHKIPVTINEYTYQVPTGIFVSIPEEVYLILVRSGQCSPTRPQDQGEVPAMITMQGPEYELMSQGGAGSMSNPVVVN